MKHMVPYLKMIDRQGLDPARLPAQSLYFQQYLLSYTWWSRLLQFGKSRDSSTVKTLFPNTHFPLPVALIWLHIQLIFLFCNIHIHVIISLFLWHSEIWQVTTCSSVLCWWGLKCRRCRAWQFWWEKRTWKMYIAHQQATELPGSFDNYVCNPSVMISH